MKKYNQSSIWDNLLNIMPEFRDKINIKSADYIDPVAAQSLYNVWKNGAKIKDNVFKRPITVGQEEVNRMKNSGLVRSVGNSLEFTDKGEKVIRIMVLGDERSSFEDNGIIIDYNKALNNTKGIKVAKKHRQ